VEGKRGKQELHISGDDAAAVAAAEARIEKLVGTVQSPAGEYF
jgi:hypothetical protein|tara:strand:- start:443 stop:571 length:129 start_codon:yes stop_codon:yes gene_type:complete